MEIKELTTKIKIIKQLTGKQYDEWDKLRNKIENIKPLGNYGSEAVGRNFTDVIASIDYFLFNIKE